jgi:hypothetical protein
MVTDKYRMHWVIIPLQWHWRSTEFMPTALFLFLAEAQK